MLPKWRTVRTMPGPILKHPYIVVPSRLHDLATRCNYVTSDVGSEPSRRAAARTLSKGDLMPEFRSSCAHRCAPPPRATTTQFGANVHRTTGPE